jgi:murein L,D-transpeptidase YcbB/YkuD
MESEKIETAMNSGEEYWYTLKTKFRYTLVIWVDADGVVHFYEDVYKRDEALASLLFDK